MHRNAPLTVEGRRRLCRRIEAEGFTIAQAAESMNISRRPPRSGGTATGLRAWADSRTGRRGPARARRGPAPVSSGASWRYDSRESSGRHA